MARKAEVVKAKNKAPSNPFYKRYWAELLIALFVVLIYSNSLRNGYNMDDELVTINHRLTSKGISAIPEIFTSPYYADDMGYAYEYRPLVLVSFAIEHSIFGDSAAAGHFFNLVFYLICCLLLYRTLLLVFKDKSKYVILAITLFFAAHPAHTEVVCSIKNRDEILGLIFSLLAFKSAFKGVLKNNRWYFLLTSVCFLLALISKVTFIPFFVIVPLAVILFTGANFTTVMLLSLAFAVPAYFVVDLWRLSYKVLFELGLLAGIALCYFFFRTPNFRSAFSEFTVPALPEKSTHVFGGFDDWLTGVVPSRSYVKLPAALITLLLFGICLLAFSWLNIYMLVPPLIILFLLATLGKETMAWWAKIVLQFILALGVIFIYAGNYKANLNLGLLLDILIVVLSYDLFFGKATFRIPAAVTFVVTFIAISVVGHKLLLNDFIFIPLAIGLLRYRKGKVLFLAIVAVGALSYAGVLYRGIGQQPFAKFDFAYPILLIMLLAINWQKAKYLASVYLVAAGLLVSGWFMAGHTEEPVAFKERIARIDSTGKQLNVRLYKGKVDRPLAFIEDPMRENNSRRVRAGTSMEILFHYLYKVVLPYRMAFYYGYRFIEPQQITDTLPLISLACYITLVLLAVYLSRTGNMAGFGIWVYLISIAIYANWVMPVPGLLAERFLLVPSLGWCIVLVAILMAVWNKIKPAADKDITWAVVPKVIKIAFVGILGLYAVLTFCRNFDWKDHLTLMSHDIGYVSESAQANNLLALNTMKYSITIEPSPEQTALWQRAVGYFKKSHEIFPGTFNVAYDIGRVYTQLNMPDSALYYFKVAQSITPDHHLPVLNTSIAKLYNELGKPDSANVYFRKYITQKPNDFEGYNNLALSYYRQRNIEKSIEVSREAQRMLPTDYRAPYNIAQAYIATNRRDSALYYLKLAQQLNYGNDPNIAQAIARISQLQK